VRAQLIEARAALDAATATNHHIPPEKAPIGARAVWDKVLFPNRQTKE
jgi:hypothetical protein